MGKREQMTIGELTVTKGVKGRLAGTISKMIKCYAGVPAAIVANRYFASAAMHNGAYAVLNSGLPGDGLAHPVSITVARVDTVDTLGKITVVGLDVNGKVITEDITPVDNTKATGLKAFKRVDSITGSGWAQGGTGADTCTIGFDDLVGLPDALAATTDVLLVGFSTGIVNAPTVVRNDEVAKNTVVVPTGDGSKKLSIIYQV